MASSTPEFTRPRHKLVWQLLQSLNSEFLSTAKCYFGGGTRIVLDLYEYRESIDVDFLCADPSGYRELRNSISDSSLGKICVGNVALMREVRADMYGIRTFVRIDDQPIKFEIISEGRISLSGAHLVDIPVEVLDHTSTFAEKFLANTDRGRDESTRSRDLIDLAYMAASWLDSSLSEGIKTAETIYGDAVRRELAATINKFKDTSYRSKCIKDLRVTDTRKLTRGLRALSKLL